MPACPGGARPKPGSEDLQAWIDRAELAVDVATLISTYAPLAWASLILSLVDIEAICAENPDPPEPITVDDLLQEWAAIPTGAAIGRHAVMEKAYRTLRYQQFLAHCECAPPPPPTGANCPYSGFGVTLSSTQATAAVPYSIDPAYFATYDKVVPGGDMASRWARQYQLTTSPTSSQVFLEVSAAATGPWQPVEDMRFGSVAQGTCLMTVGQLPAPGIPQSGFLRIRNNSTVTQTISGFGYCFCALSSTPPPLIPQPPITTIPAPPPHLCDDGTICAQIAELAHRLSIMAGQVSDIQAAITSISVLQVLSSQAISGEGQVTLPVGTKAVSIELTTLGPEAFTSALGRPRGLMRVGSVRWWDGVGYSPRRFIDGDRYDDARPLGALAISYQLLSGTSGVLKMLV